MNPMKHALSLLSVFSLCYAKFWDNVITNLSQQITTSKCWDDILDSIGNLSNTIQSELPLTSDQIADLNHLYEVVFKAECFTSQSLLVQGMRLILEQNGVIGIDLDIYVWIEFFYRFYKLNQDLKDTFVCKLLFTHMQQDGSRCVPDIDTFNIILYGISQSSQVQDAAHLSDLVFELMQYHKVIPNSQSYQNQFQIFVNSKNMLGAANLLLKHPHIRFDAANIDVFNQILAESPIICSFLKHPFWVRPSHFIWFILEQSMIKHDVDLNLATYYILKELITKHPEWKVDEILKVIKMRGERACGTMVGETRYYERAWVGVVKQVGNVHRAIQRLKQIDIGINSLGYRNYIRVTPPSLIGVGGRPVVPDVRLDLTKDDWEILIRFWRRQLHHYDEVTTDPFDDPEKAKLIKTSVAIQEQKFCLRRMGKRHAFRRRQFDKETDP